MPTGCSNRSIRQNQMAWASDSPSAVQLSKPIADGCGRRLTTGQEPPLRSQFLASKRQTLKRSDKSVDFLGTNIFRNTGLKTEKQLPGPRASSMQTDSPIAS